MILYSIVISRIGNIYNALGDLAAFISSSIPPLALSIKLATER